MDRVYTDYGVFAPGPDGLRVHRSYGVDADDLGAVLGMDMHDA